MFCRVDGVCLVFCLSVCMSGAETSDWILSEAVVPEPEGPCVVHVQSHIRYREVEVEV